MLYKESEEKELFKNLIPEINDIKEIFEIAGLDKTEIEFKIIDCINNEINNIIERKGKNNINLKNNSYKFYTKDIENKITKKRIENIIKKIIYKISRFEKEYLERV